MKRPSIALALVLGLVATASGTVASAASFLPSEETYAAISQIDVSDPDSAIADPLAEMPILDRNCRTGQTDINTATLDELVDAFHINTETAERVIAGREWLKPTDAISVPGVPPSSYDLIEANGCATPLTLPPVPMNHCRSGSTVLDLQAATQTELMAGGLSKRTALTLIAARPLPDNLHQVATPVVGGLSDPKVDRLLENGEACITPPPFTFSERTWRWASEDGGAVVEAAADPTFALYVPPGAVTTDGAYASVDPHPLDVRNMPAMNADIAGTWEGEVGVRLPHDGGSLDAGNIPMGFHWAADGLRVSMGEGALATTPDGASSVFAVTSLSDVGLSELPWSAANQDDRISNGFIYREGVVARDVNLSFLMVENTRLDSNRIAAIPTSQQAQPTEQPPSGPRLCLPSVGLARTWGAPPQGVGCSVEYGTSSATWTLANSRQDIVFTTRLQPPAAYEAGSFYSDWIATWLLGEQMNPTGTMEPVLLPESSVQVSVPEGAGQATATVSASGERTWTWFAARQLTDIVQIMEAAGQLLPGTLSENQGCAVQLATNMATGAPDPASACFGAAFDSWAGQYEPDSKSKRLLKVAAMIGKEAAGKVLFVFEAFSVANTLNSSTPSTLTLQVIRPISTGGGGGTGLPSGLMVRDNQGHAYFVNDDADEIQPIATGDVYICLSKHYAIDWAVDEAKLTDYKSRYSPGSDATCDPTLPESRQITSQVAPDLFSVLRIGGGPESWIIQGGYRWPIATGVEFNCWVSPIYRTNIEVDVFDFVSREQLETWPVGPGTISNCGDPENPGF